MAQRTAAVGILKIHLVTTTNAKGWAETGKRMAESVIRHWPAEALPLIFYAEDFAPDPMPGLEVRAMPAWLASFKELHSRDPKRCGLNGKRYDYRFDAVKFSHKVAALTDCGADLDDGILIWIDADTFTHSDVTTEWLRGLFPLPAYIAWLDRLNSHPECGLVMFRCAHPYHRGFMEAFRNLYTSGTLFKLRETHDSFALQHLVHAKVVNRKIPPAASLSGDTRWHHPFVNGPLGACMDHMKGPGRKAAGRSLVRDSRNQRPEPYWKTGP
jgi:hypothetical protein